MHIKLNEHIVYNNKLEQILPNVWAIYGSFNGHCNLWSNLIYANDFSGRTSFFGAYSACFLVYSSVCSYCSALFNFWLKRINNEYISISTISYRLASLWAIFGSILTNILLCYYCWSIYCRYS